MKVSDDPFFPRNTVLIVEETKLSIFELAGEAAREVAAHGGTPRIAVFSSADRAVVQKRYPSHRMQTTTKTLDIAFDSYMPRGCVIVAEAGEECTCDMCGSQLTKPAPKFAFRMAEAVG